jgi:hypothetical protein
MGRPWPLPGEPLFTDEDTVEILDYLADQRLICDGCGHPKAETFDPANQWNYSATSLVCAACDAKAKEAERLGTAHGLYVIVEKKN